MSRRFSILVPLLAAALAGLCGGLAFTPSAGTTPPASLPASASFDSIRTDLSDYIWPTRGPHVITSSFAEFRSSHFHAGIDISTGNRIGMEVLAARDGYVERILVSPFGYGRYLVLRHPDGFSTTYAHLSGFSDRIEKLVREEQLRRSRYSVQLKFSPDDLPVKQGEVVAYSGESGTGSPHLHFEIRDENFNPVNPLLFPAIGDMTDTTPPVFYRLAITPLDNQSYVDYAYAPHIVRAREVSKGHFKIPEAIRGTGTIGFAVDAADRSARTRYRMSVYTLELRIAGTKVFSLKRDRFPDDDTRQIGLDYDYALYRERLGRYQKLYLGDGNTLPFYRDGDGTEGYVSLRDFAEGPHRFVIVATDHAGNRSDLAGTFILNHPPSLDVAGLDGRSLRVVLPDKGKLSGIDVALGTASDRHWKTRTIPLREIPFEGDTATVAIPSGEGDVVRVEARNIWGTHSFPRYYFLKTPGRPSPPELSYEADANALLVTLEARAPFTAPPSLQIEQGGEVSVVPLRAEDMRCYTGVAPLRSAFSGTAHLKAFCEIAGKRYEAYGSYTSTAVTPDAGTTLQSNDGGFSLVFVKDAVFSPIHLAVERTSPGRYAVEPHDVMIRGGLTAILWCRPGIDVTPATRLYTRGGGAGWRITGAAFDSSANAFIARHVRWLGSYGLFDDTRGPSLTRWRSSGVNRRRQPIFAFSARDNFSGIDEDAIDVFLNGGRIIPEYDPERHSIFYVPFTPVPRGTYTVSITVKDRVGNATHMTRTLRVYR